MDKNKKIKSNQIFRAKVTEQSNVHKETAQIKITKVKEEYGYLSCMSPHPIFYNNQMYRTCEALFQSLRFEGHPEVQRLIIEQKSPMAAKMKARKNKDLLNRGEKWDEADEDLERMKLCLKLKLEQHPELKQMLIDTGKAEILEDCTSHPRESAKFWGIVNNNGTWEGKNNLGKLWMELREEIK